MDEATELLIALLARTDALWAPLRLNSHSRGLAAAVEERRAAYRRAGLPISGGGSDSQRKAASRELAAARAAGYVAIRGRTRLTAKLTDEADAYLRTLTAGYRIDQVRSLLELVQVLTDCGQHNCGAVCEVDLLDKSSYSQVTSAEIGRLEQMAAPLLATGWLCTASDLKGRIGYSITPHGRRALATRWPQPPENLPEHCSCEVADAYDELLTVALVERDGWRAESSLVVVPLSCGTWPASLEDPR